jgi:phosphohistidine phosphatase
VQLVLLRHGTAVPHGLAGLDDAERPLVADGEREARAAGRALRALKVRPDRVVTSPLVRARQTAQLAAAELGVPSFEDGALAPGFDHTALDGLFARHDGDCIVLVGHDPDLSRLVHDLTGAQVSMAKGGVARIDYPRGELRWMLRPHALRLIAKAA